MAASLFRKSTNVRIRMTCLRALFSIAERVGPRLGGRLAADLWFRVPPHPRSPTPPPDGSGFEVEAQGGVVRGLYWGSGPVVYLMHGWGGRGSQLGPFVQPLVRAGCRVVLFDAPSHGASDPGPSGHGRGHGVEFARAFDAVAVRFGAAQAVVAHSMGAVPTLLALHYGSLSTRRLVFLAPMSDLAAHFDAFGASMRFGRRVRRQLERTVEQRTGMPVEEVDVRALAARLGAGRPGLPSLLVVHDRGDRETRYDASVGLVHQWPEAKLVSTQGLGHRRLLRDREVVAAVTRFAVAPTDESSVA